MTKAEISYRFQSDVAVALPIFLTVMGRLSPLILPSWMTEAIWVHQESPAANCSICIEKVRNIA